MGATCIKHNVSLLLSSPVQARLHHVMQFGKKSNVVFQVGVVGSQYQIYAGLSSEVFKLDGNIRSGTRHSHLSTNQCNFESLLILLTRQKAAWSDAEKHLKTSSTCQTLMISCIQQSTDLDFHFAAAFFNDRF